LDLKVFQEKLNKEGFRRIILETSKNFNLQEEKLSTYFSQWKGNLDQIDDVCVIGISLQ
jgi:hypothetical protein